MFFLFSNLFSNFNFYLAGYADDDRVILITFNSSTERRRISGRDPTVSELRGMKHIHNTGGTAMSGAVREFGNVLRNSPNAAFNVLVVSDGAVNANDRNFTQRTAQSIRVELGDRNAPLTASLLRLNTGLRGSPDTKAMASIGVFDNSGKVAVQDVSANSRQEEISLLNLTTAIVDGFKDSAGGSVVDVVAPASQLAFRRLPSSKPLNNIRVRGGSTTYLLFSDDTKEIIVGGRTVPIEDMGPPQSEATIGKFFEFVEQQLRMWVVVGNRKDDITTVMEWVRGVEQYLETITANAIDVGDTSLISRARGLRRTIAKRTQSVIGNILRIGNMERVDQLNSQQQANFLRGVEDTSSGRRLARRMQKTDGEDLDLDKVVRTAVTALHNAALPSVDDEDDGVEVSFYSQSSARDSLEATDELYPVVDGIVVGDVLQIAGEVGLPVNHFVADYADPWAIRVRQGFAGVYLSEADIWLAAMQSAQTGRSGADAAVLACPGHGQERRITAVIPLRNVDPEAWDVYMSRGVRPVAELQASANMRHAIGRVPHDIIAFTTAGAWHYVQVRTLF